MAKPRNANGKRTPPLYLVIDVDGVLTDGQYYYSVDGKVMKVFGPNDHDVLEIVKKYIDVRFITGDRRGFPITRKRVVDDMHFPLDLVSTFARAEWIEEHLSLDRTIYMGDGIFDAIVFEKVAYGIAPANAFYLTRRKADFVTRSRGGANAVAEACLHIMSKFFKPPNLARLELDEVGVWKRRRHPRS